MIKIFRWPILCWLRFWAKLTLKRINPLIIGITGSAGKTSARNMIAEIAKLKFKRVKVSKKANSESGIPADILGLHFTDYSPFDWLRICFLAPLKSFSFFLFPFSFSYDCYLAEMGVDEPVPPKNMGYLLTIIKPHVGVVLNALPVHTQQFEEKLKIKDRKQLVAAIAKEKGRLISENENLELAILNADQEQIAGLRPQKKTARTLSFGINPEADVSITSVLPSLSGTKVTLQYKKQRYQLWFSELVLPEFYGETLAAALATGIGWELKPESIIQALEEGLILPPGRGRIFAGIKQTTIIDSSYNASKETMIESLQLLKTIGGKRKKMAVLGDMRELGSQAKAEHEAVAGKILRAADVAILVGPLMKKYIIPILEKNKFAVRWFEKAGEAKNYLLQHLPKNSIILIKGSQNTIFLEIVAAALLSDKKDISRLCRRGKFWDRQRASFI